MLYLWIARHGLTQHNVDGIIQGHYDTDLNDEGRIQAGLLAERLEKEVRFDAIFTSPLKRAKDTALAVHRLQPQAKFIIDKAIIERDMGAWNNRKVPPKPKKIKVVKEDTEGRHAEGTQPAPNPKPVEQASDDLVASKISNQVGIEKLSIGPAKEMPGHEAGYPLRGRSGRPEGNVDSDRKVLDHAVSSGSSNYPRQHKQSAAPKSEVASPSTENQSPTGEQAPQQKQIKAIRRKVPGMEERAQVEERCALWMVKSLHPFWSASLRTGRNIHVLLVSHGAFISTMLDLLLDPQEKRGWGYVQVTPRVDHCFNTSVTKFAIDHRGTGFLLISNNIDHLEPQAAFFDPQDFAHDVIQRKRAIKA